MVELPRIKNVLGVEQLESDEQGVFLNEDQLQAIETSIDTQTGELATAQTDLATAQQALEAAETAQQSAEGIVAATFAALDQIGTSVASAPDATMKVAAIKKLLASKIAVQPAGILKKDKDETPEDNDGWSASQQSMVNDL